MGGRTGGRAGGRADGPAGGEKSRGIDTETIQATPEKGAID